MGYVKTIRKKIGNDPLFMPCVAAIIYKDKKILLQKRTDFKLWGLHGGSMELGETFLDTLTREVKEETNLTPIDISVFNVYAGKDFVLHYPNNDVSYLVIQSFIITEVKGDMKAQKSELSELKWFKLNEIPWDKLVPQDKKIIEDFLQTKN
ncbi:NUDIX hydrolase [Alteracholeplasma palmae J233]|uniref:NUDIX hydrolase n=1 Tax=Alteracholeplasma palmae (strain ATCC 49389 / J233) TaxID=1318466 RepID=U4KK58_ALTPJ|nr:NUDIX domain-containing protein [Alteracholeplasma palmae]CCV64039.1 NUDIX hydrolase [Alteracholeplasma palmae J233]